MSPKKKRTAAEIEAERQRKISSAKERLGKLQENYPSFMETHSAVRVLIDIIGDLLELIE